MSITFATSSAGIGPTRSSQIDRPGSSPASPRSRLDEQPPHHDRAQDALAAVPADVEAVAVLARPDGQPIGADRPRCLPALDAKAGLCRRHEAATRRARTRRRRRRRVVRTRRARTGPERLTSWRRRMGRYRSWVHPLVWRARSVRGAHTSAYDRRTKVLVDDHYFRLDDRAGDAPDGLRLGPVHLTVSDLDRARPWYKTSLGLQLPRREGARGRAGRRRRGPARAAEEPQARPAGRHAGLYHFALLHPSRLGAGARRAAADARRARPISGASDHETPRRSTCPTRTATASSWPPTGRASAGATSATRLRRRAGAARHRRPAGDGRGRGAARAASAPGCASATCTCTSATSRRGLRFYRDLLGFEVMARFPSAAFVAAGGYHHHLGFNTWRGRGRAADAARDASGCGTGRVVLTRPEEVAAVSGAARGGRRAGGGAARRVPRARSLEQRRSSALVIAVTGATGAVGGRVAALLAERGVAQRLVVRDASRAPRIDGAEVAACAAYADGDGDAPRVRGRRHGVPGLRGRGRAPRDLHRSAVDAAVAPASSGSSTRRSSAPRADCTFTFGRDHFHTEEHIKATRRSRWTFLRDNIYLDYVPFFAGAGRRDPRAGGRRARGRGGPRRRRRRRAAAVLTGEGHAGQATTLTGPEAFTMAEAAGELSPGRRPAVTYVDETLEEARASRAPSGGAGVGDRGLGHHVRRDRGRRPRARSAADVERLTGRKPITLDEFLGDNPESYRHLVKA